MPLCVEGDGRRWRLRRGILEWRVGEKRIRDSQLSLCNTYSIVLSSGEEGLSPDLISMW